MDTCKYHSKTRAVMTCLRCKCLVCATCRDEGERGVCGPCLTSQNSDAEIPQSTGKGSVKFFSRLPQGTEAEKKKEILPPGPPRRLPASEANVRSRRNDLVYCSNHLEMRATGPCLVCGRPFCPACVNTKGICGRCALENEDVLRQAFPTEFSAKAHTERSGAGILFRVVVSLLSVGGLAWLGWRITHPPAPPASVAVSRGADAPRTTLTDSERAFLARLKREKRVEMKDTAAPPRSAGKTRASAVAANQEARAHAARPEAVVGPVVFQAVAPMDGAIVGGVSYIRASLSGAPTRVVCEVDGVVLGAAPGVSPVFSWDTRKSGNGPHIVTLTAVGAGGGSTTTFTLNVMNR